MAFPTTRKDDVVETLHGREIADPYRWLEDPDSSETRAWVAEQNAHTRAHLEGLPGHAEFSELLRRIMLRPTVGAPVRSGDRYLVARNDGTQPQATWYAAGTLEELQAGGEVLLDPSSWSEDGTASLAGLAINTSGTLAVYGVSLAGSDEQLCRVLDLTTGERTGDPDVVARFSTLEWLGDDRTFVYLRYVDIDDAADAPPRPQVRLHTVGTDPTDDEVVLELPDEPRVSIWPGMSSDRR
ncbi:MAG: hypothetical protein Q4G43_12040, partial [Mobilicoccus sp.]|nr:hypothetical protein [Mobilicoccus sp.]